MRLINTITLMLEEFITEQPPPYAILSHTWGDDEVTFDEFKKAPKSAQVRGRKGYIKIQETCQLAIKSGLRYAWVDTCCIDKSSSTELSEAINSMYQWYRKSAACYAFLSDLPPAGEETFEETLSESRWFSRGWTLQELIAPSEVRFFDNLWHERGTKMEHREILSNITGIDADILDSATPRFRSLEERLSDTPVATKMWWASKRQTTRPEDGAYSLLGIFDVHMPLLYGEASNAFRRLQEEIVKRSPDLSLFAWEAGPSISAYSGLFAPSAALFTLFQKPIQPFRNEFTITNRGLRAQPNKGFFIFEHKKYKEYFYGWPLLTSENRISCVALLRIGTDRFLRMNDIEGGMVSLPANAKLTAFRHQNCYILLDSIPVPPMVGAMRHLFTSNCAQVTFENESETIRVLDAVPPSNWNVVSRNITKEPTALILHINEGQRPFKFLIFAFNWIFGEEFYILDFSLSIVPYILQNVHRLDCLKAWDLEPSILSQPNPPVYHGTGGILSSYLSTGDGQSRLQITIERFAPLLKYSAHSTGETHLKHSDNHQSRLHVTISREML